MKYSDLKKRIVYLKKAGFVKVPGSGRYNVKRYYDLNGNRIFGLTGNIDRSNTNIIGAGAYLKNEAIVEKADEYHFVLAVEHLLGSIDELIKRETKERVGHDEGQEIQSRH